MEKMMLVEEWIRCSTSLRWVQYSRTILSILKLVQAGLSLLCFLQRHRKSQATATLVVRIHECPTCSFIINDVLHSRSSPFSPLVICLLRVNVEPRTHGGKHNKLEWGDRLETAEQRCLLVQSVSLNISNANLIFLFLNAYAHRKY